MGEGDELSGGQGDWGCGETVEWRMVDKRGLLVAHVMYYRMGAQTIGPHRS